MNKESISGYGQIAAIGTIIYDRRIAQLEAVVGKVRSQLPLSFHVVAFAGE